MSKPQIHFSDFEKIDIRTGTITQAESFPEARKSAYKLKIDFGTEIGIKVSSAQITENYSIEDLIGKQILAVVNFPPKQIANFKSECLVLGIYMQNGSVTLISPESSLENGLEVG